MSAPVNTHSQNFAEPLPSPGQKTRHVVSPAWKCHDSRFRSAIAAASGASSTAACATVPVRVAGEISAPCRASPVTSEFWLRPAANRSTSSIAVNPLLNRPFPIALGGPGAVTVACPGQSHAFLYRRRPCAITRTRTVQSSTSVTWSLASPVNGSPQPGQQYPPPGKSQMTSTLGRCE